MFSIRNIHIHLSSSWIHVLLSPNNKINMCSWFNPWVQHVSCCKDWWMSDIWTVRDEQHTHLTVGGMGCNGWAAHTSDIHPSGNTFHHIHLLAAAFHSGCQSSNYSFLCLGLKLHSCIQVYCSKSFQQYYSISYCNL